MYKMGSPTPTSPTPREMRSSMRLLLNYCRHFQFIAGPAIYVKRFEFLLRVLLRIHSYFCQYISIPAQQGTFKDY